MKETHETIEGVREETITIRKETEAQLATLRKDIQDVRDAIISKQEQSYKRIITIQAGLLSPIFVGVIVYIIQLLVHH